MMIREATIDCYNDSEATTGWLTMLQEKLALPLETVILRTPVSVERVELSRSDQIVVRCARGKDRQRIPILDLPLPNRAPSSSEWIEAYRRWLPGK